MLEIDLSCEGQKSPAPVLLSGHKTRRGCLVFWGFLPDNKQKNLRVGDCGVLCLSKWGA